LAVVIDGVGVCLDGGGSLGRIPVEGDHCLAGTRIVA
jgi:hypothetical protein